MYLFPIADDIYTYDAFLQAAARFPKFCYEGDDVLCKHELATFFAHTTQEVGKGDPSYIIKDNNNSQWSSEPNDAGNVDKPENYGLLGYLNVAMSIILPFSGSIFACLLKPEGEQSGGGGGGGGTRLPTWRQSFYYVTEIACTPPKGKDNLKCDYASTG